ncbi:MAG: zf-HC2 domain-containing protein [Actinomycetota bacterium]
MKCEIAERELSARLDGDPNARLDRDLSAHLATCHRCRAFAEGADRLRQQVRREAAEHVPDLVPRIMAEVRREPSLRRAPAVLRLRRPVFAPEWSRAAVAFAAAAVVAALVVVGVPGLRRGPTPALATEIPQQVADASLEIGSYRAIFDIVERNFHARVPVRRFEARVAFESPERFRAQVIDRTDYPEGAWPRNDLALAVDGTRWQIEGPLSCPREGLPNCAVAGEDLRAVTGREPFDGDAPLPTDIVLPVRTLAGTSRVQVVGEGELDDRSIVTLTLAARDAQPLFAFLQTAGLWRPFFPLDEVLVSLDGETLFPLAYEVFPASSPEREVWAVRNGLPLEGDGRAIFQATARSFSVEPQPGTLRAIRRPLVGARDEGFRDASLEDVADEVGYELLVPTETAGLAIYRTGTFVGGARPRDEALISYARGLAWLKIRQTRTWSEPALFGDVGSLAMPVSVPGGGVAYYEPASGRLGRRLSIHADGVDVYVESNLPQSELLEIAGSLPIVGEQIPASWRVRRFPGGIVREHVSLRRVAEAAPYLLMPAFLPPDYRRWAIHLVRAEGEEGVTVYFRRPGAEFDGVGIRLHQSRGTGLPPPMDPDVLSVRVRGEVGRYVPTRSELEWVEDGVYHSIRASGFDLKGLLQIAESLAPSPKQ